MRFYITPMKVRGKALDQNAIRQATPVIGDVVIGSSKPAELGRMSDVASIQTSGGPEALPLLYDVRLSFMGPQGMVLSGLEIISGISYGQSWWMRALA